jgi:hypothetical protein
MAGCQCLLLFTFVCQRIDQNLIRCNSMLLNDASNYRYFTSLNGRIGGRWLRYLLQLLQNTGLTSEWNNLYNLFSYPYPIPEVKPPRAVAEATPNCSMLPPRIGQPVAVAELFAKK